MNAFLSMVRRTMRSGEIDIWCIQSHDLEPSRKRDLEIATQAGGVKIQAHVTFGRERVRPSDGERHFPGGVMTLTNTAVVDSTLDTELERHAHRVKVVWHDRKLSLVNFYAPSGGMERIRVFRKLGSLITKDCTSCGDWNCVPDVQKDVRSGSAAPYANLGGRILNEFMEGKDLMDYHRHQLGNDFDWTRAGNTSSGVCRTRIDRWYVPTGDEWADLLWNVEVRSDVVVSGGHNPLALPYPPA